MRPRIDLSGPLTDNLLYRLNAVYVNEDGFRDFEQNVERGFISPALTWRISDRTDLNLQLEYLDGERPLDTGLVALGDAVADLPSDRILGEPDDEIDSEFLNAGYTLEHRFSANIALIDCLVSIQSLQAIEPFRFEGNRILSLKPGVH